MQIIRGSGNPYPEQIHCYLEYQNHHRASKNIQFQQVPKQLLYQRTNQYQREARFVRHLSNSVLPLDRFQIILNLRRKFVPKLVGQSNQRFEQLTRGLFQFYFENLTEGFWSIVDHNYSNIW